MKRYIYLCVVLFLYALGTSCGAGGDDFEYFFHPINLKSSTVDQDKASELELYVSIDEDVAMGSAKVEAVMRTLSDEIPLFFDENEKLTAISVVADGTQNELELVNFLSTKYFGDIVMPPAGSDYIVNYLDPDGVKTSASFSASEGGPQLITPTDGQEYTNGTKIHLTWTPKGLRELELSVNYCSASDGTRHSDETIVEDSGSYEVLLDDASGEVNIELKNVNRYSQLPGFGKTTIEVKNGTSVMLHTK